MLSFVQAESANVSWYLQREKAGMEIPTERPQFLHEHWCMFTGSAYQSSALAEMCDYVEHEAKGIQILLTGHKTQESSCKPLSSVWKKDLGDGTTGCHVRSTRTGLGMIDATVPKDTYFRPSWRVSPQAPLGQAEPLLLSRSIMHVATNFMSANGLPSHCSKSEATRTQRCGVEASE